MLADILLCNLVLWVALAAASAVSKNGLTFLVAMVAVAINTFGIMQAFVIGVLPA